MTSSAKASARRASDEGNAPLRDADAHASNDASKKAANDGGASSPECGVLLGHVRAMGERCEGFTALTDAQRRGAALLPSRGVTSLRRAA